MLLASFNYTDPSSEVYIVGIALGLAVLFPILFSQRIFVGVITGVIFWSGISWLVFGSGRGDMVGFLQLFCSPVFGVVGGIAGAIAAFAGKKLLRSKRPVNSTPD